MLTQMTNEERSEFLERSCATAIANQAVLKCMASRVPLTADNIVLFVSDFLDPDSPYSDGLMERVNLAIDEIVDCAERTNRLLKDGKD